MRGTRAQQSGQGRGGACLLAALLLCFSFLPLHAQNQTSPQAPVCGRTKFQGKIFGGQKAGSQRWPWQASLLFRGSHICGAVLIDKNWVASAAHCFQRSRKPSDYRVLLGYHQLGSPTGYSRQMRVNKIILHENFNKFYSQGSDIVLIQLYKPVTYSSHILPACVPENTTEVPLDMSCWISGWGMIREDVRQPLPDDLHETELILMDNAECKSFFPAPAPGSRTSYYIYDDMVCAADYEMTKSICAGDSGGPLVCLLNGSWYLVGLTSWSASCETPIASPSVFARVSYFDNWIKEHKKASPDPKPPGTYRPPPHQRPPWVPKPPIGSAPWNSDKDQDTVIKPVICMALLSSGVLLQLV